LRAGQFVGLMFSRERNVVIIKWLYEMSYRKWWQYKNYVNKILKMSLFVEKNIEPHTQGKTKPLQKANASLLLKKLPRVSLCKELPSKHIKWKSITSSW